MRHRPVCAVEGDGPEADAGDDQMQIRGEEGVEEPVEARRATLAGHQRAQQIVNEQNMKVVTCSLQIVV